MDLNILDDVISAVDELVASDTNAVSEGLLLPREDDDDEGSHEILSRWDSQGEFLVNTFGILWIRRKAHEFLTLLHQNVVSRPLLTVKFSRMSC